MRSCDVQFLFRREEPVLGAVWHQVVDVAGGVKAVLRPRNLLCDSVRAPHDVVIVGVNDHADVDLVIVTPKAAHVMADEPLRSLICWNDGRGM